MDKLKCIRLLAILVEICGIIKQFNFAKQMKKVHPLQINNNFKPRRQSADQTTDNTQSARCRFCKQNISDKVTLAAPCLCIDYIHTYCVPQEMEAAMQGEIISSRSIRKYSCKRCKGTIRFQNKESVQCRSCDELAKFRRNNEGTCMWLTIGIFSIILLITFLVILAVKPQIIHSEAISYNSALIATAITLGTVTIFVVFFLFSSLLCKRISNVTILANARDRKMSSILEVVQLQ